MRFADRMMVAARRRRRLTLIALLCAGKVSAQASSCPSRLSPAHRAGESWFVSAEAATPLAGGLLTFGQARVLLSPGDPPLTVVPDTNIAAFILRTGERPQIIRRPSPDLLVNDARVAQMDSDEARVLFTQPVDTAGRLVELWTARVRPHGWTKLHRIGRMQIAGRFTHQLGSELVAVRDTLWFAAAQPLPQKGEGVVLVSIAGDSVAARFVDLGFRGTSYAAVGVHAGELWLAVMGNRQGELGRATIWLFRRERAAWGPPLHVAGDRQTLVTEPKILSTPDGLVVAWSETRASAATPEVLLRWRGVVDGRPGPTNEMPAYWPLVQGEAPFNDVLSVRTDDSTSKVLRLSSSGFDLLATLPSLHLAPLVAGTATDPVAIGMVSLNGRPTSPEVAMFDLRCAFPNRRPAR